MSTFVEVNSIAPKNCKLIINLDNIVEIAPLVTGGCVLFFNVQEAGNVRAITVADDYSAFVQFAMQTVSADDIAKRFPKSKKEASTASSDNIKPPTGDGVHLDIPTFGNK